MSRLPPYYAIAAGFLGSAASFFGKLSSSSSSVQQQQQQQGQQQTVPVPPEYSMVDDNDDGYGGQILTDDWIIRLSLFGLMILTNVLMWWCFVRALRKHSSTIATVASSTTNYFCSALIGYLFLNETVSFYWWLGTSLVLIGIALTTVDSPSPSPSQPDHGDDHRKTD